MEKGKEGKKVISIDIGDGEGDADEAHSSSNNGEHSSENSNANAPGKKTKKMSKALKDILTTNNTKFMSNFDPELSNRERRKLSRKLNGEGKKNGKGDDENANSTGQDKDICDCLMESCVGCHFPCPKCRSCKCAVDCRANRKWVYETVENETEVTVMRNSSVPTPS